MQFPKNYRCQYRLSQRHGDHAMHTWELIGARGAVHLCIIEFRDESNGLQYSAGVETHFRHPPRFRQDDPPDHDCCHILKQPCWHDGTSLLAEEKFLPMFKINPNDHESIFAALACYADDQFQRELEDSE